MVDIVCFLVQDCVSIVEEPIIEIANVHSWHGWPSSNLGVLEDEFVCEVTINVTGSEAEERQKRKGGCISIVSKIISSRVYRRPIDATAISYRTSSLDQNIKRMALTILF